MNLTTNVGEDVERKEVSFTGGGGGCKLIQPLWKSTCRVFKKLKLELPYDPCILLLAYTQRTPYPVIDVFASLFITSLFTLISLATQQQENR